VDGEAGLHAKGAALLDGEGFILQRGQGAILGQVDDDVVSALDFQAEGFDDDGAGVVGVADGGAGAEAERFFPFAEGFIVGVYGWGRGRMG
jgi:hypothetical protein